MTRSQKKIVKGYCWTTSGLGVVLGPGIDAAPLAAAWVTGCVHLIKDSGKGFDEAEIASAVGTIVAGFGAWFVSGKVAQVVAAALVTTGLAGAGVSAGLTIVIGLLATLSLNATINALFTYRFMAACAEMIGDSDVAGVILLKAFANQILHQLISLLEIPQDLAKTAKLMFNPVL